MKTPLLLALSVMLVCAANAQFTILPQIGLENSRTAVTYNKGACFSPLGAKLSPQAAVRFSYSFNKVHGPYLGLATSRSIVQYGFTNPEAGMSAYTASQGSTQLRLEGGYQVSSPRIYFKKAPATKRTSGSSHCQKNTQSSVCSRYIARSGCGSKANGMKTTLKKKDTRTWIRIQPSLGVAYIPGAPRTAIYTKSSGQPVYAYNAGNWETAVLTGVSLEFGKAAQSKFNISLNYVKGLGMNTKSITTGTGGKPVTTNLASGASAWNLRMGIPLSFAKKQPVVKHQSGDHSYKPHNRCGQYKSNYGGRCTRVI